MSSEQSVHGEHGRWSVEVGRLIESIDSLDLPRVLIDVIATLVPHDMGAVLINRGRSRPLCLCDTFPNSRAKAGLRNYLNNTYVLNPFYQAHLAGIDQGVYRIGDLAPDGFFETELPETFQVTIERSEEIGFLTQDWPKGMEELDIAIPLGNSATGEIDIFRSVDGGGFNDRDIAILADYLPVLGSALKKFWSLQDREAKVEPLNTRIDELFENFGKPHLTDREQEVIRYVLKGHSSDSISLNLDISVTTVKTHRKRAYAKLGISSQSELLSLFLQSLDTASAA